MPSIDQSDLKKKDFVTLKNTNTGEVVKVIFPNGIQIGVPGSQNFNSAIVLPNFSSAPDVTENALYAVGGTIYFNGTPISSFNVGNGLKTVAGSVSIDDSVVATVSGTAFTGRISVAKSIDTGRQSLTAGVSTITGSLVARGGPNAASFFGSGSQTVHLIGSGANGSGAGIVFGDYSSTYGVGIFEDTDDTMLLKASGRINIQSRSAVGVNNANPTADFHVGGNAKFDNGLSGSLTNLVDGTSYLIAGSGVSISTGSNGSVTVSGTSLAGDESLVLSTQVFG